MTQTILLRSLCALALMCSQAVGSQEAASPAPLPPDPAPAFPELKPVFDQFGGKPGLKLLMDDFMVRLLADARMHTFFEKVEHDRVKRELAEQFCVILGGDCVYSGRDMVAAHEGFIITAADFNRLVEILQVSMDARDIPERAQNALIAKLAPMHREIITPD